MPEDQYNSPVSGNQPPSDGTWSAPNQPTEPAYPAPVDPYATGTGYQPPSYETPKYESPVYESPTYQAPSYEAPTYQAPGPAPTQAQPGFPGQPGYQSQPGYQASPVYQPGSAYQPGPPAPGTTGWMPGGAPAPMPTPWAVQPAPARSFRTRTLVLWLIVTALVCACAGFFGGAATNLDDDKSKTTAGGAPETTASAKVATKGAATIAPGDSKALKAHLAAAPAGAKAYPIDNSSSGVMTLDQFVKNAFDGDTDEKARLQQRGFLVAVQNDWAGADSVEFSTQLLQFSAASGAEGYVTGQHDAFTGDSEVKASYKIPGTTLGYGFEKPAFDKAGNRRAFLICQDGPIVIVMFVYTPGQFDRTAEIAALQRQLDALGT
jgi:hypothetical protein